MMLKACKKQDGHLANEDNMSLGDGNNQEELQIGLAVTIMQRRNQWRNHTVCRGLN
jgi:hypothetical protein